MFFTDTNIPLGYTIIHDKWHKPSKEFIEKHQDSLFWSNLVQEEYSRKLEKVIDNISSFLESSEDLLLNNQRDFINYFEFEKYIFKRTKDCELDSFKKQRILEHFWEKFNFQEGVSGIISSKFTIFAKDFENLYYLRQKSLNQIMNLHDCGLDNYLKYIDFAKQIYKWGVHSPDCKIITDAHDCGLKHKDLIFVTTDDNLLKTLHEHDTHFLNIVEFKPCN